MVNPLLQAMMGNNQILNLLKSKNPEQIAMELLQNNRDFKNFMEANKNKTPEQVAKEHGLDLEALKKML